MSVSVCVYKHRSFWHLLSVSCSELQLSFPLGLGRALGLWKLWWLCLGVFSWVNSSFPTYKMNRIVPLPHVVLTIRQGLLHNICSLFWLRDGHRWVQVYSGIKSNNASGMAEAHGNLRGETPGRRWQRVSSPRGHFCPQWIFGCAFLLDI